MNEQVTIKTGFKKLSDSQALAIAGAVINGVFVDKAIAAAPPFDETTLQTAVDDLTGAIARPKQGGGTAVTAVKNKSVACWMVCCVGSRNTFRRTLTMTCSSC